MEQAKRLARGRRTPKRRRIQKGGALQKDGASKKAAHSKKVAHSTRTEWDAVQHGGHCARINDDAQPPENGNGRRAYQEHR